MNDYSILYSVCSSCLSSVVYKFFANCTLCLTVPVNYLYMAGYRSHVVGGPTCTITL